MAPVSSHVQAKWLAGLAALAAVVLLAPPGAAEWVEFADETSTRYLGLADTDEKEYAWGDVDRDGDTDLVVVRKEPFTSPGKRVNFLLLNENGVLVDRTTQYATASDVPGDQGFNTPTNDRDVVLVDLDLDGWLDMVTAVTISDGDPKAIGHPRIYMNRGCTGACAGTANWLGFRYEQARIPALLSWTFEAGFNPRFCSVAAGDLTGDGYPELWFGDYDSSGAGGSSEPPGADFNDRLLLNQGDDGQPGFFTDVTQGAMSHFSGAITIPGTSAQHFAVSAFGAAGEIKDVNGDGINDIVKQTSLNSPLYVGVAYNDPASQGFFDTYEVVALNSPYFVSVDDLNNDSKLDMVITDDGDDRYLLNQGNGPDGLPDFQSVPFSFSHSGAGGASEDDGFGSDSVIADLDNDGWNDVLIADVDVDISGCTRRLHIYHNLGGNPGDPVVLEEETDGSNCELIFGNPSSCRVATIPSNKLEGVHDVAVFDLNGDGWKDLVVGRCSGTEVYINQPSAGVSFLYPLGLPTMVPPGQTLDVQFQLQPYGGATVTPGTVKMFVSIAGGAFAQVPATSLGGNLYRATLPAAGCAQDYRFYFSAGIDQGGTFVDPVNAPLGVHTAIAAVGTSLIFLENVEGSVSGWGISSDPLLTAGEWEQAVPVGTLSGSGFPAAPAQDGESDPGTLQAFVTENGLPGGTAAASDVDGGPTTLVSPPFNLTGTDGLITYSRWFFTSNDDSLVVQVSGDGANWQTVETVTGSNDNSWTPVTFRVGQYVTPTSNVRVRFVTSDFPDNSITEAAIDLVKVEAFTCLDCLNNSNCDDGLFCNGAEVCNGGACGFGPEVCTGEQCDETANACVECFIDAHCNDGQFCNGVESCAGQICVSGSAPCSGQQCEEVTDSCVDCLVPADCDDGSYCNGPESCLGGSCFTGAEPCAGQFCDEGGNVCLGQIPLQARMGQPLVELSAFQKARFNNGRIDFEHDFSIPEGLGPIFNQNSCGACHNTPVGGSGSIEVTRFGHVDVGTGTFDPLESLGGSLLQAEAITDECKESLPPEANITARRVTPSTLGFGLLEVIPGPAIQALADNPPAGVSGRVHLVEIPEAPPGTMGVGRFGWKSQAATLMSFSAGAARNEMGITNRVFRDELPPNGDEGLLATCDTVADPEDHSNQVGLHFIDRINDFQRFLAPPPQTPKAGMTGEAIFASVGCNSCHVSPFTTADIPQVLAVLRNKTVKPYSDFLLHDMGGNADQIVDADAGAREIRTMPLWGIRVRDPLWHDGRVAGGTFAERILAAIALHDDPFSEAQASAQAFAILPVSQQDAVVAFLDSLGRAEFDFDGDNDVDLDDWQQFSDCFSGPGSFYTPDDFCAIADANRDGDVDDGDMVLFLAATSGVAAGRVPDGASAPGTPLRVGLQANGQVVLTWGTSCAASDTDYSVYAGTLGDFTSHEPVLCSTGGVETATLPVAGDVYFLVVPHNGGREGSYGVDSTGTARPRSIHGACFPPVIAACATD